MKVIKLLRLWRVDTCQHWWMMHEGVITSVNLLAVCGITYKDEITTCLCALVLPS